MPERDWIVPVGIKARYWDARFYAGGHLTAKDAEASVRLSLDLLAEVLGVQPAEFEVGPAVTVR